MENNLFQNIKEALKGQYGGIIAAILPGGKMQGHYYVCGSLSGGAGQSCKTDIHTGKGRDYAQPCDKGWNDIIDLAAQAWNKTPLDAVYALAKQYGIPIGNAPTQTKTACKPSMAPVPALAAPAKEPAGTFTPIIPIPENAPELPSHPPYTGKYCYRNAQGEELFYILRYDEPNGGKSMRPICYCADRDGTRQWCFKMPKEPRPLYGLDRLAKAAPGTPVLLVEGEKTADAAQVLFPGYVCITWSGGSNAAALTDFLPIADRPVCIWPDNDAPGLKVALDLLRYIEAEKADYDIFAGKDNLASVRRIILPPENLPPKWDLADAPPDDFNPVEFLTHSLTPEEYARELFKRHRDELGAVVLSYMMEDCDDFDINSWPVLSRDALPGIIGECVDLATADSEADPVAVLATLFVRFAAEVYGHAQDKGPFIYVGETVHPPRVFVVITGNSAKARKGTSQKPVERFFGRDLCDPEELARLNLPPPARESGGPLSTGEGLAYQVRDNTETEAGRDPHDKRLFIMDEELSSGLACMRREGNTLSMAFRVFWDSGDYTPLTKNNPVRVTGAHINIISHITKSELKAMLPTVHMVNGFANRILWICARRTQYVSLPKRMPTDRLADLQLRIWKLVAQAQALREVGMTPGAKDTWRNVYRELSQEVPGIVGAVVNRAEAQTLRLALIYALFDGKSVIDTPHIISALALWRYAHESAVFLFGENAADPVEQKILALLKMGPATATQIHKAFSSHISRERLQTALGNLESSNKIRVEKRPGRGRPSTIVTLRETAPE